MFKKIFLFLLFIILFFLTSSTKNLSLSTTSSTLEDEFLKSISQYKSFNPEMIDLYYQEYLLNHNLVLSLNKINVPDFFNRQNMFPSFTFEGGPFVNKNYYLTKNFIPDDLVPVTISKVNRKNEVMLINKTALTYAKLLFEDAKKEGMNLVVFSAYRSYIKQKNLYQQANNKNYVAKAGFSEHQTGLAIDIATLDTGLTSYFEKTREYEYLTTHAHLFGFIKRYPKDKNTITKYPYEAWHYRFVGPELAKIIYEHNMTLEEYIYTYVALN